MTSRNNGLLVIGAGHMRTGTFSLKLALERLYGGKCYHMAEISANRDHFSKWINVLDQEKIDKEMCDQLFQGYCCAVDYPASLFYKDLMDIYPDAKIILTTRDVDSWLKSSKATTLGFINSMTIPLKLLLWLNGRQQFIELAKKAFSRAFHMTIKDKVPSDEYLKQCFEISNEEARRIVPKEKLLEFHIKDGWKPLCEFLDFPEPEEPFPFVNSTDEFHTRITRALFIFFLKLGSVLTICVASGFYFWKRSNRL